MAEQCPTSEVSTIKEDDTPMECETSEPKSTKADSPSDKGALTLPVSGATSAAASTQVSDSESTMNSEDARVKEGALALPVSGATSASVSDSECAMSSEDSGVKAAALRLSVSGVTTAAASTSVSDSRCAMSPDEAPVKEGASTLPSSGSAPAAVSDSEVVASPDDTHAKVAADPSGSPEPSVPAPISGSSADNQEILSAEKVAEIMSPEKEKVGLLKGMKTAIKTKIKSAWKKLSPKKSEKAALAASVQDAEPMEASGTDKKPIKVVTYVSASRGSLVVNSIASDEVTLDTELPTSSSEVFLPDQESIATCDTATHASRLPSLGESEPAEESPEHKAQESSVDRGDEAMDDENVQESS